MLRRRQVRLSYPQAFAELALLLALRHGRRNCARVLGVPLSTVYRWLEHYRRQPDRIARIERSDHAWLDELIGACEAHGFDLRERIGTLEPLAKGNDAGGNPRSIFRAPGLLRGAATPAAGMAPPAATISALPFSAPLSAPVQARVALARGEIDRHYYSQLSCEMLAGIAGMSRFHFIRTFKAAFAVAPYHYLMQVRIHHAKVLLSTTQQPLDAVAAAVGFDTQSSMCKAFRSIEGVSLATFFHGVRLGSNPRRIAAPGVERSALGRTG
ncbi:MAG TPA: AraC family transcriptional regulator [Rhodanobacteraceae bacterium]|jgi:AraC-like DNA-binding protein|nr:AraC family transcriptional regulator [Rhodanobacteraceae bacterium]